MNKRTVNIGPCECCGGGCCPCWPPPCGTLVEQYDVTMTINLGTCSETVTRRVTYDNAENCTWEYVGALGNAADRICSSYSNPAYYLTDVQLWPPSLDPCERQVLARICMDTIMGCSEPTATRTSAGWPGDYTSDGAGASLNDGAPTITDVSVTKVV